MAKAGENRSVATKKTYKNQVGGNIVKKVIKELNFRAAELEKMKSLLEEALLNAPDGFLRVTVNRDKTNYYQRLTSDNPTGKYIRENQFDLAAALAQKDYNNKILKGISNELKNLNKFLKEYQEFVPEHVFESLHPGRQKLITPIRESDEQYIRNWKLQEYPKKGFDEDAPIFITDNNERVRSKSEVLISHVLNKLNIPYRYEYPLTLYTQKGNNRVPILIHPDFTLLDIKTRKEIYFEHLGKMDDPGYVNDNLFRLKLYEQNGIYIGKKLIISMETKKNPLNITDVENKLRAFFEK